jgi:hypothetical protein
MPRPPRKLLPWCLLGLGLLALGVVLPAAERIRAYYREVAEDVRRLPPEFHRSRDLDERLARAKENNAGKLEVAQALIAGQITLPEAAAHFQTIDQQDEPDFRRDILRVAYPGRTDAERYCRYVIKTVAALLVLQPERRAAVIPRLEEEFEAYRRNAGGE